MTARTKKKRPLRFRFFLFLLLSLALAVGLYYFLSLPIWQIQEVVVRGAVMLSAQEIKDLSGVPLRSNLFLTDLSRVRGNLRKITAIKSSHLYRIPPATVLITIRERKPVAVVVLDGKSAIVDDDGYILNRNPNLALNVPGLTDLPVISGVRGDASGVAERIDPQAARLIAVSVKELLNLLGSRRLQIEIGDFRKIALLIDDLLRVKIGRDEEIAAKLAVFRRLLPVVAGRWDNVEYIDVRFPDNPVIKYKQP